MAGGDEISAWVRNLNRSVAPPAVRRISQAAGLRGKKAATTVTKRRLGSDMAMSNFMPRGRKVPARLGFDPRSDGVDFNFRPKGVWVLANSGRKRAGFIESESGRALTLPDGFRAYSAYYPSRGTGVLGRARGEVEDTVPSAAFKALQQEIRKVLR